MKLTILIISLVFTTSSFGQDFKRDWATFQVSSWSTKFIHDTTSFLEKPKQGQLIFINKVDSSLTLTYNVYLKSEVDSTFSKKINNWMFIQSCLNLNFTRPEFTYKQYYYLLAPCQSWSEEFHRDCKQLSKQLGLLL